MTDRIERIGITRAEGTRFTLAAIAPAAPGAALVLVVPAMGTPARFYERLLGALADEGHGAAVTELRGHEADGGRRPGWRYDFGYADLVADLAAAVDALAERWPDARLHLLGHSLGGQVSSVYAAHHADRLDGLMLVAAGSIHWRNWSPRFLALSQGFAAVSRVVGHFPGDRFGFAGREARGLITDWARFGRTGRLRFGRPRVDHDAALARLRIRTLAVSFAGDTLAPPRSVDGLLGKLPAVDLTRVHLEPDQPVDHFRWARRPDTVVPTLHAWLAD